jgi:glycosyltransferase involved in cell wall biosynthesis
LFFKPTLKLHPEPPTIQSYRHKSSYPGRIEGGLRVQGKFRKKSSPGLPLITILTIVYNGEKSLDKTIHSVLNQTYDNIEYIVIDGGSTDNTVNMINKYEDQIAYWISEPDSGISDAFNKGIVFSTGEMIGIINADDWYSQDAVEILVDEYLKSGECVFHAKLKYWTRDMKQYYVFSGSDEKIWIKPTFNHPTVFVPKSIYDKTGLFRLDFKSAMDYEWFLRAKVKNVKFCYLDKIIANMSPCGRSDIHWWKNYLEVMHARNLHGMNPVKNFVLFLNMVLVTFLRKSFEWAGLNWIVLVYRKYFSIVRKEKL